VRVLVDGAPLSGCDVAIDDKSFPADLGQGLKGTTDAAGRFTGVLFGAVEAIVAVVKDAIGKLLVKAECALDYDIRAVKTPGSVTLKADVSLTATTANTPALGDTFTADPAAAPFQAVDATIGPPTVRPAVGVTDAKGEFKAGIGSSGGVELQTTWTNPLNQPRRRTRRVQVP
jgi:hypothetical protein